MQSSSESIKHEVLSALPPVIINNARLKLEAEQVSIGIVTISQVKQKYNKESKTESVKEPETTYPLKVIYFPKELYFEIKDIPVCHSLRVWNDSVRSIYVACVGVGGISDDLGASCRWYPRTRSLLAPGLSAVFFIKVTPKKYLSVSSLHLTLQLAAAHRRNNTSLHFVVPIIIAFLKYVPPNIYEDG